MRNELSEQLDLGRGYPRPQLQRTPWKTLNGDWEFALDPLASCRAPSDVVWDRIIRVPFAVEAPASGVNDTSFSLACWYRRTIPTPQLPPHGRLLLHFGAVDYRATVWINDRPAGTHEGGYTPFTIDATSFLVPESTQTLVVRAEDDPLDLAKPRGKQDWQLEPHSIWYPRTSGIWQTVWFEIVPETWIRQVRWTSNLERWEVGFEAVLAGNLRRQLRLHVKLSVKDVLIADDTYAVVAGEVHRRIALSDPGIDDYRNTLLWSPETPTLIHADIELWGERGDRIDSIASYTALRSVAVQRDRFLLNGRPYYMRLVLDQGYWPDTGLTAPDDAALRFDVETAKRMGFNGVRKHQKLEDPRYLYWADRLGLLVWGEMPSAYRFTRDSVERVTREWADALARDYSHPCIVAWVPFNESWGVPNLPESASERHYVQALYHLTRTLDATRPVIGNDGWESVATDIIGIHDYDSDPERIARRYHSDDALPRLFRRERPAGRLLILGEQPHTDQPIVLSEFGGIACAAQPGTWGYSRAVTPEDFASKYASLLKAVRSVPMLSGFCYTQFADTYQEANGLLYADRTPKFAMAQIAAVTRGVEGGDANHVSPLDAVGLIVAPE